MVAIAWVCSVLLALLLLGFAYLAGHEIGWNRGFRERVRLVSLTTPYEGGMFPVPYEEEDDVQIH